MKRENPPEATEDAVRSAVRNAKSPPEEPELPIEVPEEEEGGADEIESLRAQLALCQERSRETAERMKEAHDRMLRAAADLENFKKRAQREKEELQKFGNEKLLRDLLPVLDNLDRALAAVPASDPLAAGVSLVRSSFEQVLTRNGVKSFSAMGQPFDPAMHEALMQVASTEAAPGTVVVEHARGFTLNDRLVRPALVGVAVAPSGDQGGEGKE